MRLSSSTLVKRAYRTEIIKEPYSEDVDLQPMWHMEGVGFITESLVTLNKVYDMLRNRESYTITEVQRPEYAKP